jgi:hypothetical protein
MISFLGQAMVAAQNDTRCKKMIVAIIISLVAPYTVAWVQRDATVLSSLSFSRLNQKPNPLCCIQRGSVGLQAQGDDSLDLYRTVAEQDPEWYREFVLNALGEDLLENGVVADAEMDTKRQADPSEVTRPVSNGSQSPLPTISVEDPVDRNVDQSYKLSSDMGGKVEKSYNESSTGNIFQLPNYRETQPTSEKDKDATPTSKAKQDLSQEVDQTQTELKVKPAAQTPNASGQAAQLISESNNVGDYSDTRESEETAATLSAARQELNEMSTFINIADRTEASTQDEADVKISAAAALSLWALSSTAGGTETEDLSKELDLDSPLAQDDRRLGPEEERRKERAEITETFPDSQAARETLSGPEPPTKEEVRGQGFTIKTSSERNGDATTKEKVSATGMSSTPKIEATEVTTKRDMDRMGARSGEDDDAMRSSFADEGRTVAQERSIKESPVFENKKETLATAEPSKQDGRKQIITAKVSSKGEGVDAEVGPDLANYVVLYRDLYTGRLQPVNLTSVTKLGYNVNEIPYLQPDALALIVEDEIRRPSRGIPQQWKISQSQYEVLSDDVRIVPQDQAEELLETANKKQRGKTAVGEARKTLVEDHSSDIDDDDDDEKEKDRDAAYGSGRPHAERKRPSRPHKGERPASIRSKDRRRRDEDESPNTKRRNRTGREGKKRIYNAREIPAKPPPAEEDDPPSPNSLVWVDIDTFRKLLRNEAELRVRILGEDWADIVKEESDWRLRLYKEWLWALHHGIGSPLVPSRSDRAREKTWKGGSKDERRVDGTAPRRPTRRPRPEGDGQPRSERIPVTEAFDETATSAPKRLRRAKGADDIGDDEVESREEPNTRSKTGTSERVMGDYVQEVPRRRRQAETAKREMREIQKRSVSEVESDMEARSRRRIRRQPGINDEADLPSTRRSVSQDGDEDCDPRSRWGRTHRRRTPSLEEYEEEENEYDDDWIDPPTRPEARRDDDDDLDFRPRARRPNIPRRRKTMRRDNDDIE